MYIMSSDIPNKFLSKEEEDKLRKSFDKKYANKNKADRIDSLFESIQQSDEKEKQEIIEANTQAIETFTDLFKPQLFSVKIGDMTFFFKHNLSIFEYEELRQIQDGDTDKKLKFFYNLLHSPKIDYDLFKDIPAYYIKYVEQKIYDFFLNGIVLVKEASE